jgi:hypothetical protein
LSILQGNMNPLKAKIQGNPDLPDAILQGNPSLPMLFYKAMAFRKEKRPA